MNRFSIFLIFLSICFVNSFAKQTKNEPTKKELRTVFQKAYGGEKSDIAYDVVGLGDSGFIIVGSTKSFGHGRRDVLVTKFDKNGKPLVRATYGGKQNDYARAIVKTADGNFIVVGSTESFSKDGDLDLFVVKFDKNCNRIWQKNFGGKRDEEGYDVVATPNGGVLIAGYTESYGKGYKDGYILYLDKDGKPLLQKAIGGKDDDILKAIALNKDGSFVVCGKTRSFGSGGFDFYVVKFNKNAKYLYKRVYGGEEDDELRAITKTKDGGFVVAGNTQSFDSKHDDIDVIRYDKNGQIVWHKIFGFKSKEWANSITTTKSGGFIVAGTTKSFGFGDYDIYLLELNSKGSSIWANVYGGEDRDMAYAVKPMKDGTYMVVGKSDSYGKGEFDFIYLKLIKR